MVARLLAGWGVAGVRVGRGVAWRSALLQPSAQRFYHQVELGFFLLEQEGLKAPFKVYGAIAVAPKPPGPPHVTVLSMFVYLPFHPEAAARPGIL